MLLPPISAAFGGAWRTSKHAAVQLWQSHSSVAAGAGGRHLVGKSVLRKVVVDVREFMSSLPAVLHQQALDVIPVTLEVLSTPPCPCPAPRPAYWFCAGMRAQ